jgi:peptidoglycan/LPS O-acetylase OafA/YrhL
MRDSHPQRTDIQALRGYAVLAVVLFHAKVAPFSAGYLGVDIFFVISGFLITRLVAQGIADGSFSLRAFYLRRARRLLPAAYATLLACCLLAPWLLLRQELHDFAVQVAGALTFTANLVMWQQTGYFEGDGEMKPLLHMWSLSVEEQYYLLLPALLLLLPRGRWRIGIWLVLAASALLCVAALYAKPVAAFYLLPTRAWEMLIGSAGALRVLHRPQPGAALCWLFPPALLALLVLPMLPYDGPQPGPHTALACAATLVVMLRASPALEAAAPARWLARIGDFSYSLYLVHWPVLAFASNMWVGNGQPPVPQRLLLLLLIVVLALALYRWVEVPARFGRIAIRPARIAAASCVLAAIAPLTLYSMPARDAGDPRRPNYGLAAACEFHGPFAPIAACRHGAAPDLLVWGDSIAMHLVPGLVREWDGSGIVQATRSLCGPLLGLAAADNARAAQGHRTGHAWAEDCIAFNRSVLAYLRATPSVRTVVLSSTLAQYVTDGNTLLVEDGATFRSAPPGSAPVLAALRHTVAALRSAGKTVVLVAPPPTAAFDIGACQERRMHGAPAFGAAPDCIVQLAEYRSRHAGVARLVDRIEGADILPLIRFEPVLCGAAGCVTRFGATALYRDREHFSVEGSVAVARAMALGRAVRATAR